ncbi:RagB/SusD family nutrient uptake outer membrane protein [Bacteroides sp. GM023]|uniref:RagB/SusD family nutrient uptake outer membrane protein n=1 Tax=Bacteroides sp. GM023 TaxID=2723058 RepID=UPI00168B1CCF|nr:RagB/SusD family nutrient uptake outer membrane protein [Bacteroides sp. GM023]MBD3588435.1 RagB/SusD family nutrient uptake outer membrane protein [Bacteroides sp. GM023]
MKKNWLSYMLVSALLSGALTSCSDSFLDLKDPNHFTNENFWKDKADAESALAAAYSPIKYQMYGYYGAFDGWLNLNSRGDDIFTILNEEASMWDIATFQNSATTGNDPYGALYAGIQRANIVLRYIDKVPASGITESDRATIKGEALTLRAYQYFLLVSNYGAVPLRLIPSNEDEADKKASPESEIWAQVEKDLLAAIKDGNLPENRPAEQKGRIERGAAITILGKVYATQHKYAEAKTLLKGLIDSSYSYFDGSNPGKRYRLMENFVDNFTTANENNAESVFELQYSSDGDMSWGNEGGISLGSSLAQFVGPAKSGGWAKLMPSAFLVSEFTTETRGSRSMIQDENGDWITNPDKTAEPDSKYDKRIYASMFFTPSEYGDWVSEENGWYDGKFYGGLFTMDDLWTGNASKMAGGAPIFNVSQSSGAQIGRFLLKKYTAHYVKSKSADNMGNVEGRANNVRAIRFAETLLLYAEACAKVADKDQANWALNEIRQRAGLPKKDFEQIDLMKEIEHQCLLEFFGEGHRFDDLKRWYTTPQIQMILKGNDKQGAYNFKEKYKYFPIPAGELNNSSVEQNELWK